MTPEDSYDLWRDQCADELEEVLTDTFNAFVRKKDNGYYKDRPERFKEHAKQILEAI